MLTILAGVATGEPEIVLEQQRDGIAELKAEGKYKGRTPTVAWQIDEIRAMHANGLGAAAIARQHICGLPARVYRTLGVVEVPEGVPGAWLAQPQDREKDTAFYPKYLSSYAAREGRRSFAWVMPWPTVSAW